MAPGFIYQKWGWGWKDSGVMWIVLIRTSVLRCSSMLLIVALKSEQSSNRKLKEIDGRNLSLRCWRSICSIRSNETGYSFSIIVLLLWDERRCYHDLFSCNSLRSSWGCKDSGVMGIVIINAWNRYPTSMKERLDQCLKPGFRFQWTYKEAPW